MSDGRGSVQTGVYIAYRSRLLVELDVGESLLELGAGLPSDVGINDTVDTAGARVRVSELSTAVVGVEVASVVASATASATATVAATTECGTIWCVVASTTARVVTASLWSVSSGPVARCEPASGSLFTLLRGAGAVRWQC